MAPGQSAFAPTLFAVLKALFVTPALEPLITPCTAPPGLAPTAQQALREQLALGATQALAKGGGWRQGAFAPGPEGSPWGPLGCHPPPALPFSDASWTLLCWLVAEDVRRPRRPLTQRPHTAADQLLYYLACGRLQTLEDPPPPGMMAAPLCRLGFADYLPPPPGDGASPDPWPGEDAAAVAVLAGLQGDLARRWLAAEAPKYRADYSTLAEMGRRQAPVLHQLLTDLETTGGLEGASFIVEAAALQRRLGPPDPYPALYQASVPLAQRQTTALASAALWGAAVRVGRWAEGQASVGYFDPGYPRAQGLLRRWDALGMAGFRAVSNWYQTLIAVDGPGASPPSANASESNP